VKAVKYAVSLIILQTAVALSLSYAGFAASYNYEQYVELANQTYSLPTDPYAWITIPLIIWDTLKLILVALFAAGTFYSMFIPLPNWFSVLLSLMFDLIYIWSFAQFITQRSGKLYD